MRVVRPVDIDRVRIGKSVGEPPLLVEHVSSPSIMVDGRFHTVASRWLWRKHSLRPVETTIGAHAYRLASQSRT